MIPPLEETFAGNVWRVQAVEGGFAVLGTAPTTFGAEVELCRVQYLPHAMAIAALPEMVDALTSGKRLVSSWADVIKISGNCAAAIHKAEGRHILGKEPE